MKPPLQVFALLALAGVLALALFRWVQSPPSAPTPSASVEGSPVEPIREALAATSIVPEPTPLSSHPVPVPSPPPAASAKELTEDALADAMHQADESENPGRALALARQGRVLWPEGARAPEFAAIEVKSLYRLGRPSEGRGAAEAMVNKYPSSPWALEVERNTGAHPHVNH